VKKLIAISVAAGMAALGASAIALAQQPAAGQAAPRFDAHQEYLTRCSSCHDTASAEDRTPPKAQLALMGPDAVVEALTRGSMKPMAEGLNEAQITSLAVYITGKQPLPKTAEGPDPNLCPTQDPIRPGRSDWNGWGYDSQNTRYQPTPGLSAADVPRLKVKWAFAYPGKKNGQATIIGNRIFVTSNAGKVYSLNADTGCVYWRYDAKGSVRTSPVVARNNRSPSGWVVYWADDRMDLHASDAMTGKIVWTTSIEKHPRGVMTGTPTLHDGVLYVPTSSMEETVTNESAYVCCTFRGSITAVDARTGKVKWKTYAIPEEPKVHRQAGDKALLGPAGAAIWAAPTVDPKLKRIYFATGDGYTDVKTDATDAVIALDMRTGKKVWSQQVTENDAFLVGCTGRPGQPANCPEKIGPDWDFGQSPILRNLPNGKRVIVIGQKSGVAYGFDPDANGKKLWEVKLGTGGPLGGIQWGSAADTSRMYVANADTIAVGGPAKPGLWALDLATGKILWEKLGVRVQCSMPGRCTPSHSAAVTAIPGAVFSGTLDAHLRAYDSNTGEVLWDFDAGKPVDTVNGQKGVVGGAIDATGPTIANGVVYQHAGYSGYGGTANGQNVLFAFSVDGK
jgi:polyvinyl alcohol dehydrogenase (cytochrome)